MTAASSIMFPSPNEIEGFWDWDKIHAPRPLTPLAGDAVVMSMAEGFTIAQHDFGSPLALSCRMFDNYLYAAFTPDAAYTPPTTDLDEYTRELENIASGIGERWINEWEPSLIPILERARTADFTRSRMPTCNGRPRGAAREPVTSGRSTAGSTFRWCPRRR